MRNPTVTYLRTCLHSDHQGEISMTIRLRRIMLPDLLSKFLGTPMGNVLIIRIFGIVKGC